VADLATWTRAVLYIAGYAVSISLFITATVLCHRTIAAMIAIREEVNERLPVDSKFNPPWYGYGLTVPSQRVFELLRMHRQFFPESFKRRRMWLLTAGYSIAFLASFLFLVVLGQE
jgi:hypothetical protein